MYPGRSIVPLAIGITTFSWRTEIWELTARFLFALVRWLINRIEVAAAEAELRAILTWSVSCLIFYLLILLGIVAVHFLYFWTLVSRSLYYIACGGQKLLTCLVNLQILLCNSLAETITCKQKRLGPAVAPILLKDRSALTFQSCMDAGSFILIAKDGEWDEALLVCHNEGSEWLCYSTDPSGARFIWVLIRMTLGNFRMVEGRDGNRLAPPGVPPGNVNWMCDPGNLAVKWSPTPGLLVNLCAEGRTIMDIVKADVQPPTRHIAGSSGEFVELIKTPQAQPQQQHQQQQQQQQQALAQPAQAAVAAGIGPPALRDSMELQKLADVVNSLRSEIEEGKVKKKKGKKKRSKGRKRSSSSNSSSDSSRSSSSSSFVKWKMNGKSRKVSAVNMGKVDTKKFKKRSDLLIFAAKHPGALTANFINALRQKLMKGGIVRTSQLRDIEMTEFVTTGAAGLKEVRDRREALTILQSMDFINQGEVEKAMDVLAMRVTALLEAKASGGTWDKAAKKELIPEESAGIAPAGLTGLA